MRRHAIGNGRRGIGGGKRWQGNQKSRNGDRQPSDEQAPRRVASVQTTCLLTQTCYNVPVSLSMSAREQ